MRTSIITLNCSYFDFVDMRKNRIDIESIATSLSNICRFTGHVSGHYSVAQHSVLVSHLVEPEFAMQGLLHDAAEAFIGDVSAPLKQLLPDYRRIEERVERFVFPALGLPYPLAPEVKIADLCALATEDRDVAPDHDDAWEWEFMPGIKPAKDKIDPWPAPIAQRIFLMRYAELINLEMLEAA